MNQPKKDSLVSQHFDTDTMAAAHLGAAICEPTLIDKIPVAVIPDGFKAESLEAHLLAPTRKRHTTTLRDAASFIKLVTQEATETSRIFGGYTPPKFMAVFNEGAGADNTGWRDHRAVFDCPLSVEWKAWTGVNKKAMPQAEFAQFIEDNLPDIVEPPAAAMLEISRTLEAKKKVEFASGIRLHNGQQELTYNEEIKGTAGKGKLEIPEIFVIGISVLEGGPRYRVECRLRYRIDDGALAMWIDMLRPHKIVEDAVKDVWQQIQSQTGIDILNGAP